MATPRGVAPPPFLGGSLLLCVSSTGQAFASLRWLVGRALRHGSARRAVTAVLFLMVGFALPSLVQDPCIIAFALLAFLGERVVARSGSCQRRARRRRVDVPVAIRSCLLCSVGKPSFTEPVFPSGRSPSFLKKRLWLMLYSFACTGLSALTVVARTAVCDAARPPRISFV